MRLTLIMLKYLNMEDADADADADADRGLEAEVLYDIGVDGLIDEVQSIMSDWNAVSPKPSLDKSEKFF